MPIQMLGGGKNNLGALIDVTVTRRLRTHHLLPNTAGRQTSGRTKFAFGQIQIVSTWPDLCLYLVSPFSYRKASIVMEMTDGSSSAG